jgi:hypothetical protein
MDESLKKKRDDLQNNAAQLDPDRDKNDRYNPNKRRRAIRRQVYERFWQMRDNPARVEAEADWELADKEFRMYFEPPDSNDWRADIHLPDAFASIQIQEQERIERRSRPQLDPTEESDEPVAELANAVMTYNMNTTGFDYQYYLGKLNAASRGTTFWKDYWRCEKRIVKDPVKVNDDGSLEYKEREIIDFDDDYTEWKPNERVFVDEKAGHIDDADDWIEREVLNIEKFYDKYGNKPGFFDTDLVKAGGETGNRSFFKLPEDITNQDVEILHYENKMVDAYWVVANNIVICDDPLQTKHKQLSLAVGYQYKIPGYFFGVGIPKIIHYLSEERRTIRNLNLDRQKVIVSGAFLHNTSFEIDEEDTALRPGGFIGVETNGQPISNAVMPMNMGDVPASYFKTEEIMLEDQRRATGIDDRISVNTGSTATQAAIVKESTLKRINLVSITNEMDTIIRIGRLKWSNLQFFSPIPRIEKITEDNEEREEPVYRKVSVKGKKFKIITDNGKKVLRFDDVRGKSAFRLNKNYAKYLQGDFDISVGVNVEGTTSKAISQTKKTELFSLLMANPATQAVLDINGAVADLLRVNDIDEDTWMKNPTGSKKDMMMLAEAENTIMASGQPLDGTSGATEDHTLVHLMYTKTREFEDLPPENQQIIMDHILQEHDNNPATGQSSDLLGAYGLTPKPELIPGGMPGGMAPSIQANTSQPQAQMADLQATNYSQPE